MYHYEKTANGFNLVSNRGNVLCTNNEITIGYDRLNDGSTILMKHGCYSNVKAWLEKISVAFEAAGLKNSFELVSSADWEVEDLSKVLDITGYLDVLLKKIEQVTPHQKFTF